MSNKKTKGKTSENANNKAIKIIVGIFAILAIIILALLIKSTNTKYTVDFKLSDDSIIESQIVKKGDKVSRPENPTKDYYIFDDWYTDKELTQKYDFSSRVTKNLTLYAGYYLDGKKVSVNIYEDYLYLNVNEVYKVYANINPDNLDIELVWSSSNEKVATVDSKGHITGISNGTATITVSSKDGKVTDSVKVYVIRLNNNNNSNHNNGYNYNITPPFSVTSVSFDDQDGKLEIQQGNSVKLDYTINPSNAANKNVTFTSSDESVATVDEDGNVTGVGVGTAIITVTTEDGKKTDTIEVTVTEPDTVINVDELVNTGVSSTGTDVVSVTKNNRILTVKPSKANIEVSELFGQNFRGALLNFLNSEGIKNIEVYVDGTLVTITKDDIDVQSEAIALISNYINNQESLYRKEFKAVVNLKDGYVSENGKKSETYTIKVEAPDKITVTFNDREQITDIEIYKGSKVERPADPQKENADFTGWYDGDTLFDFDSLLYSNITLIARFSDWTVVDVDALVTDGVNSTNTSVIEITKDARVLTAKIKKTNITESDLEGQNFRGALLNFLNTDGIENIVVNINSTDITVTKDGIDTKPEALNLIANYINNQTSLYGTSLTVTANLSYEYISENGNTSETYTINVVAPDVTITYMDGTSVLSTDSTLYNTALANIYTPSKDGFKFAKWINEDGSDFDDTTLLTQDINVYAVWNKIVYVDTLVTNGVNSTNTSVIEITKNAKVLTAKLSRIDLTADDLVGQNFRGALINFVSQEGIENLEVYVDGNLVATITKDEIDTRDEALALISSYLNDLKSLENADIKLVANLKDGYVSENNNTSEEYTLNVEMPDKVTVKFMNGNEVFNEQQVYPGEVVSAPASNPTKDNATFNNWYKDADFTEVYDFSSVITEDTNIYAKFDDDILVDVDSLVQTSISGLSNNILRINKDNYAITVKALKRNITVNELQNKGYRERLLNLLNADGVESITLIRPNNESINITKNNIDTTSEAISFITPFINNQAGLYGTSLTAIINLKNGYSSIDNGTKEVTYNINIEAPDIHTVSFKDGNDTLLTENVYNKEKVSRPQDPTKEGSTFDNWYKDSSFTELFDFDTEIENDTEIFAKFDTITHRVRFMNESVEYEVQDVNDGATVSRPEDPTKEGYTFKAWVLATGGEYDFSTPVTGDIDLYAKFEINKYTVSFDSNGSNDRYNDVIVEHNNTVANPGTPYKEGYRFIAWKLNGVAYDFDTLVTSNMTLVAHFKQEFTVVFYTNGGTSIPSQIVLDGDKISKPTTTRDGYVIVGWYTDSGLTDKFNFNTPITSNTELYAKWALPENIHNNVTNSVNSVSGNFFNASIDPNANDVTVTFTETGLNTTMLGMADELSSLLTEFATNSHYESVILKYSSRSIDVKSASLTELARMLGYIGKGSYSGSVGIGVVGSDLVGKTVQITVNLVDGYASENGNESETYYLHFN